MIRRVILTLNKFKKSLESHERHTLIDVIGNDLIRFGKLPFYLLICTIVTAVTVTATAHCTRLLTIQYEQLVLEYNALDTEWRNLLLEEHALGEHSRIERIAMRELQMLQINPSLEEIIVQKIKDEQHL